MVGNFPHKDTKERPDDGPDIEGRNMLSVIN